MAANRIQRAVGVAAILSLLISAAAMADTIRTDGDSLTAGAQNSINLGAVEAGGSRTVDVDFTLTCKYGSHVTAGSTIALVQAGLTLPGDGDASVTQDGWIAVPADWPSGADCSSATTITSTQPATVRVTAPTTTGPGREFDVEFAPVPETGATSSPIYFTIYMDVVDAAPADTTPPVLNGVPDSVTVTTTGDSAVVSWVAPTATDDTDPSPTVSCDPVSGSTFGLGTTTVTCTATDASGNSATASFEVTVEDPPADPADPLVGHWGRPLNDSVPALVGHLGRTIPVKLTVTAGGEVQRRGDIDAPVLWMAPLDTCTADATVGTNQAAGTFGWTDGAWHLNLRTGGLDAGCWLLTARVGDVTVATAVVQLRADPLAASAVSRAAASSGKAQRSAHDKPSAPGRQSTHGSGRSGGGAAASHGKAAHRS
jgi:hypothetical protein